MPRPNMSQEGLDLLLEREGFHATAENLTYTTTDGKTVKEPRLTVGYGHYVLPTDINPQTGESWKHGDEVDDGWAKQQLALDVEDAVSAAVKQRNQLGSVDDQLMLDGLIGVNYQMGTKWRSKFPTAWKNMVQGDFDKAATEITRGRTSSTPSLWSQQTPVRVADFQKALRGDVSYYTPEYE